MKLTEIKGVGEVLEQKLNALDIFTVEDLLETLPKSYIDLSVVAPLSEAIDGSFCLLDILITEVSKPFSRGKIKIFRAIGNIGNIPILLKWYNSNYIAKQLKIGEKYTIYGKVKFANYGYEFNNPQFEKKCEHTKFSGVVPIYITKGLISQGIYRNIVKESISCAEMVSLINKQTEQFFGLLPYDEAYKKLHLPTDTDFSKAKERVILERVTRRIAAFRCVKNDNEIVKKSNYYHKIDYSDFLNMLPFSLTSSQINAIDRIEKTLCGNKRLNTILCGDVGSGKTVVAGTVAVIVVKNGYQAALLAPTEVLARQHFQFFVEKFSMLGKRVELLVGSTDLMEKRRIKEDLIKGKIDFIIGTHALLSDGIAFENLGLVIADEQHRFGVAQRTKIIDKTKYTDVLTLSATPIPRSLQLAAYGEVDYITIDRRYVGNVKTRIVPKEKRVLMWEYLAKKCRDGGQAFVVAPKIVDCEGLEQETVTELYKELSTFYDKKRIGLLHGKLKTDEKKAIVDKFSSNDFDILISTTVIEVGIDIPNASIIVIADADKFGLATLHQLRGRVGRNGGEAYCFLYTSSDKVSDNLKILTECEDGFKIAEADFNLRGSGELLGLEQSGKSTFDGITLKMLNMSREIAETLNLDEISPILQKEIEGYSLKNVTLN